MQIRNMRYAMGLLPWLVWLLYTPSPFAPAAASTSWAHRVPSATCAQTNGPFAPMMGPISGIAAIGSDNVWFAGGTEEGVEQPVLLHFDGAHMQTVPLTLPESGLPSRLTAIGAASDTDIWAVGAGDVGITGPIYGRVMAAHYDGRRWSVVSVPSVGDGGGDLRAIAVISSTAAWAVGARLDAAGAVVPLVARWDGVRWTLMALPTTLHLSELNAVGALSVHDVWAVGGTGDGPAIAHYDGRTWSSIAVPAGLPPNTQALAYSAAVSGTDIWAAGSYDASVSGGSGTGPVMLHWNGRAWHNISGPNSPTGITLNGVAAITTRDVWAMGDGVEHWDGSHWHIVADAKGSPTVALAAAGRAIWTAVTLYDPTASSAVRRWDGSAWRTLITPAPVMPRRTIAGIAAIAPRDLWAAGAVISGTGQETFDPLMMHWNGATWQRASLLLAGERPPAATSPVIAFAAVAGSSPADVWALTQTYVQHWDGQHWRIAANAPLDRIVAQGGKAAAMATRGSTDAWIVGDPSSGRSGFTEHWDGVRWTAWPGPAVNGSMAFNGVAMGLRHVVWAVGTTHGERLRPLTAFWDGRGWRNVPVPHIGPYREGC